MKKLLATLGILMLSGSVVNSTISCSIYQSNVLKNLLNFREIDYTDVKNIDVVRKMQEDVLKFRTEYFQNVHKKFNTKYNSIVEQLKNKVAIDVDQKENTKVGIKSQLIDTIYLGQQPFGYYYPRATYLHEINRYEMPNFSALEQAGYTLYINNSNDEGLEIVNVDKQKEMYEYEGKNFVPLLNENGTDCIYFKTTELVDASYASTSSTWSFIALKGDEVLTTKPNSYNNTTISVSIVDISTPGGINDYAQYKMGDWVRYDLVDDIDFQAYHLTTYLLIYIELVGNYLQLLEKLQVAPQSAEQTDLINGMNRIIEGRFTGVTSAGSLYAAIKFGFNFDMFTLMQDDGETTVNLILDQNMGINVKIEEDVLEQTYTKLYRDQLNFNPYLRLDDSTISFARRVWKLNNELVKLQNLHFKEHQNDSDK